MPPAIAARTANAPGMALAVRVGAVAMPFASVMTAAGPANEPLGPTAGAVNMTTTPGTGKSPSRNCTRNGGYAAPTTALGTLGNRLSVNVRASTAPMSAPVAGRAMPR